MTKQEIISQAMTIPGMVSEWDLDLIYDQAQEYITEGGAVIEIGGWKGRSTYVIASVCKEKGAKLYEMDTFAGVEDPISRKNQDGNLGGYYEAVTNPNFIDIMKANVAGLPRISQNLGGGVGSDPRLFAHFQANAARQADYYRRKWGGDHTEERFFTPFNNPHLSPKDWTLEVPAISPLIL